MSKGEIKVGLDIVERVNFPVGVGLKTWYVLEPYMREGEQAVYNYLKSELIGHASALALMKFVRYMAKMNVK